MADEEEPSYDDAEVAEDSGADIEEIKRRMAEMEEEAAHLQELQESVNKEVFQYALSPLSFNLKLHNQYAI
jgi:Sec-independent protein translocase protein TatA